MASLTTLKQAGQSLWLDYIDRDLIENGGLKQLVDSGLGGVTSNPTIFYKAIAQRDDYDGAIRELIQADPEIDAAHLYHWLTLQDIQHAADQLRGVYDATQGCDGFVSIEVSPHLAYDAAGTVEAARHLWAAVHRPNVMIKVPGTQPGLAAIQQLLGEGLNVNITLLFSVQRYREVLEAFQRGVSVHPEPGRVASVASFFVSRVDQKVDARLDAIGTPEAKRLKGKAALANARLAYEVFKTATSVSPFTEQRARGAQYQRPLWASTSSKNPEYADLIYVDQLVAPHTVNTVPPATLDAFTDHGEVHPFGDEAIAEAHATVQALNRLGIDLEAVAEELEREGVDAFNKSYDDLITLLDQKRVTVTRDFAAG